MKTQNQTTLRFNPPSFAKLATKARFALKTSGGFSFDANGEAPAQGYMVSEASDNHPIGDDSARTIGEFIRTNPISANQFYGGWHFGDYHETNGATYLDVSRNVATKREALALAIANEQIAVYDVANRKTLYVVKKRRDKRRQYTVRQRINDLLRRYLRLVGMANQVLAENAEWSTIAPEYHKLRDTASEVLSEAQDLAAQLGESGLAWDKRFYRLSREFAKQYA